ncbi:UDP-2,3-diacylglucosamine diphosphatase [Helicobacter baculiformis]|uniref:UDP-2,3-diacylglucosamine diphosphatase n=1 Tax=Helicobacter baculiformis TaxID=427351 RepID=A0ABV7ZIK1_9HELI|nr:UDP-2,3-diacylglucosamine hydrolase [Helicobacter baculiformis]
MNLASYPTLSSEAIFIADAHHKPDSPALPLFLDQLSKTPPKQVFLMGDIFHILVGKIASTLTPHRAILEKIHALSKITQVFYFEGNHDLGLGALKAFQHVRIYPRSHQPAFFLYQDRLFSLAHGDLFVGRGYECYIRFLNHAWTLKVLASLDALLPRVYPHIQHHIDAKSIRLLDVKDFAHFAQKRLALYAQHAQEQGITQWGGVIEGHFHAGACYYDTHTQGCYYSLPCFYRTQNAPTLQTCMSEMLQN